jgi:hypothetical protein
MTSTYGVLLATVAERTRDALRHKRAIGEVYNHAPLGYERHGKSLIAVEEQAALAEVHRLAAQGASLRAICAHMQQRGYQTKRGGVWRPSTIQGILRRTMQ